MSARLPAFLRRRPPPEALAWAASAIGDGARVVSTRRLRGGQASSVHALTVEDASGERHRLALRRYVRAEWLAEEPDLAEKEAQVLQALEGTGIPAPVCVAMDADGSGAGVPAVLMRLLPGRLDISPGRLEAAIEPMAEVLARIHAIPCQTVPGLQPYRVRHDPADDEPPPWSRSPEAWRAIIAADRAPLPKMPPVLIQRDYHPANVLWSRGRLSGVVDWADACCGPPGIDVAHGRGSLVAMLSLDAAERFREAYERASGTSHDPRFDARDLMDGGSVADGLSQLHDAGRADITREALCGRLDEYARLIAKRLDGRVVA